MSDVLVRGDHMLGCRMSPLACPRVFFYAFCRGMRQFIIRFCSCGNGKEVSRVDAYFECTDRYLCSVGAYVYVYICIGRCGEHCLILAVT